MNEHDEELMARYGITAQTKVVFHYGSYRYDRLADAVSYAQKQEAQPKQGDPTSGPGA